MAQNNEMTLERLKNLLLCPILYAGLVEGLLKITVCRIQIVLKMNKELMHGLILRNGEIQSIKLMLSKLKNFTTKTSKLHNRNLH